MGVFTNICPECQSKDIQCIDRGTDVEGNGELSNRWLCWNCDADWHVDQKNNEIL